MKNTNTDWIKLIEEKENEIMEVSKEAYQDALLNPQLYFTVELDEDGKVYSWYQSSSGNEQTASSFYGESIELMSFCNQYGTDYMDGMEEGTTEEEAAEWVTDEYAAEEINDKLSYLIEELREQEELAKKYNYC